MTRETYGLVENYLHFYSLINICPPLFLVVSIVHQYNSVLLPLIWYASSTQHLIQRGHSGDGCDLKSTLFNYDLRNGDLFVLSCARGSISSELLMCGGGALYFVIASCGWMPRDNK